MEAKPIDLWLFCLPVPVIAETATCPGLSIKIELQLHLLYGIAVEEAGHRAVKAMGYEGVEFAGLFGKTGAEVPEQRRRHDV